MNKELRRLTVVLDVKTDRALRYIAQATDQGLSEVVRELISEPAWAYADMLDMVDRARTTGELKAVDDTLDMFVEGAYGDYLQARRHG